MSQLDLFLCWFRERYPDEVDLTCEQAFGLTGDKRFVNPKASVAWAAWQHACNPLNTSGLPTPKANPPMPTMVEPQSPVFNFGKYRGRAMSEVLRDDPQYIAWAYNNAPNHGGVPDELYVKVGGVVKKPSPMRSHLGEDPADDDIPF